VSLINPNSPIVFLSDNKYRSLFC